MKKSKIIYKRLFEEYDTYANKDEFMSIFGLSRQSFYDRSNAKNVDYDEIIQYFPEVNRNWLYSESEHDLKGLPVRKKPTIVKDDVEMYRTTPGFDNLPGSDLEPEKEVILRKMLAGDSDLGTDVDQLPQLVKWIRTLQAEVEKHLR